VLVSLDRAEDDETSVDVELILCVCCDLDNDRLARDTVEREFFAKMDKASR
jgi:hypothetical protein